MHLAVANEVVVKNPTYLSLFSSLQLNYPQRFALIIHHSILWTWVKIFTRCSYISKWGSRSW